MYVTSLHKSTLFAEVNQPITTSDPIDAPAMKLLEISEQTPLVDYLFSALEGICTQEKCMISFSQNRKL